MAATKELDKHERAVTSAVDPRDEPSAEWGWHGSFPKATQAIGWALAVMLLALQIGPHHSNTENYWLIGTAATIVAMLLWDLRRRRTSWRR